MTTPPRHRRTPGRRPGGKTDSDTRTRILKSARCVFAGRGFDGASIREVAQAAEVNTAMIYYHFRDKVGLYRAVISDCFTAFDRIWDHAVFTGGASAREQIRQYVEELVRFQQANEELRRIISMEFATSGRNLKWLAENLFQHSYRKLELIIQQGIRNGELRKTDAQTAIAALVGMVIHCFILRPVAEIVSGRRLDLSVETFGTFVCTLFFDGLGHKAAKALRPAAVRRRAASA